MARKESFKKVKLEEKIVQIVNAGLRTHVKDPRLTFASATRVELSDDQQFAKIYWDCFQVEKKLEVGSAFSKAKGILRSKIASVLKVRSVPSISFIYDSKLEDQNHIEKLLDT
jgi:ribosome-binding factor A